MRIWYEDQTRCFLNSDVGGKDSVGVADQLLSPARIPIKEIHGENFGLRLLYRASEFAGCLQLFQQILSLFQGRSVVVAGQRLRE